MLRDTVALGSLWPFSSCNSAHPENRARVCDSERCGGPPRGVPKSDFARLDYYDVWFPNLSPSAELVQEALGAADDREWAAFSRKLRQSVAGMLLPGREPLPQVRLARTPHGPRRGSSLTGPDYSHSSAYQLRF